MKKLLLITLLSTLTAYSMDEESFIKQPDVTESLRTFLTNPDTKELRVSQEVFNNVLERVHNFPKKDDEQLSKVFSSEGGQGLLRCIRRYGAYEGTLPGEGLAYLQRLFAATDNLEGEFTVDHAQLKAAGRTLCLHPFCGGTRTTGSEVQRLYGEECHMVSSIVRQEVIKEAVRKAGCEGKVKFAEDMRLWNYRKLLQPKKNDSLMRFSDIDYIVTEKTQEYKSFTAKLFEAFCSNEDNCKTLLTVARAGIWSFSQLAITEDNRLFIRNCRPPDNMSAAPVNNPRAKECFLDPKKEKWNTHALYSSIVGLLDDHPQQGCFKKADEKILEERNAL